jgi:hypothetical protein
MLVLTFDYSHPWVALSLILYTSSSVEAEPCICMGLWTFESDTNSNCKNSNCTKNQIGCPAVPCDHDPDGPWCYVRNPGCATEENSGDGWSYCNPADFEEDGLPCDASDLLSFALGLGDCTNNLTHGSTCQQKAEATNSSIVCTKSECRDGSLIPGLCPGVN